VLCLGIEGTLNTVDKAVFPWPYRLHIHIHRDPIRSSGRSLALCSYRNTFPETIWIGKKRRLLFTSKEINLVLIDRNLTSGKWQNINPLQTVCLLSTNVEQRKRLYEGVSKIFRTDAVKIINLTTKRLWKLPTSTQLRATWHTDSLGLVVLSTSASRYHNCCIDGGTSPEYFGYTLVFG
jgi:hypothetical protein